MTHRKPLILLAVPLFVFLGLLSAMPVMSINRPVAPDPAGRAAGRFHHRRCAGRRHRAAAEARRAAAGRQPRRRDRPPGGRRAAVAGAALRRTGQEQGRQALA
ncbi:exported hypothetical protein [uncultured Stenotrophomonas sp.]|uniref:Uncharacterized protein n=1 Tax=uncultured Stenotrophomonas sp. TaxID=165438 RepID=A0A1Y5Q2U8_9GAMM|nr:exported hypothetical protein [uncultured Stenotrophomonas sp.]